jgi:hypothetical protein
MLSPAHRQQHAGAADQDRVQTPQKARSLAGTAKRSTMALSQEAETQWPV